VCWRVEGVGLIDHSYLGFYTASQGYWYSWAWFGEAPRTYCENGIEVPCTGDDLYIEAYADGPADTISTGWFMVDVTSACPLWSVSFSQIPTSVTSGSTHQVCWFINAQQWSPVYYTDVGFANSAPPNQYNSYSSGQWGWAPGTFCQWFTFSGCGNIFMRAHAYGSNNWIWSNEARIFVC
jgi:hypothetical protein